MNEIENLKAQLFATRLRVCDAHAAVWRAMQSTPEDAHQACQDDGYLHLAIHDVLQLDVDLNDINLNDELTRHIAAQDERINRLEAEILRLRNRED